MNFHLLLSTLNLCLGGLVFLLGLVILRENPGQRLNRLVALTLFFGGLGAVLAGAAFITSRSGTSVAAAVHASEMLQNFSYLWEFFFPTVFLFASVFPEERSFARRREPVSGRIWLPSFGVLVFAPHVFHFVLLLVVSVWKPQLAIPQVGPLHYLTPLATMAGVFLRLFLFVHQALFSLVNLGFGLMTMLLLFDSYRHARVPRLKLQLRVIAIGISACLVCYSFATSIPGLFNFQLDPGLRSILTIAALTLGPGSIAYSIVRYKFLDAKLLARRGILYALASAALVGVYLLVVGRVSRFLTQVIGLDARVIEPVMLIMALALFQPVIARMEEILDQTLLKDPSDYRNILRQLGRELQTTIDLEELLTRTIRTVAEVLLLDRAHVVALTRQGAIVHTGKGAALTEMDLARLGVVLPRVSARESGYRVADPIEGVDAAEQSFLADGLGLSLVVPLRWRGEVLGALLLGHKVTGTNLTAEDVNLLTALASQVSVSLQNALLLRDRISVARFEEELNLARQIQRTSLISEFPVMPNCEVHGLSIPSKHVGGDFYDVVPTEDGAYLVAIADVSGKGVPAALLSSMLQASLRTQAGTTASVSTILRNINGLLFRSTAIQQFATFFLARVDSRQGLMTFSNAGHNWPVVFRANGERQYLERGGTVLGILETVEYEEERVRLAPGDRVVLYTDGISEAMDGSGEFFGDDRLCDIVQHMSRAMTAREISDQLLAALRVFLGSVEPQDDMTLLVLRMLQPVISPLAPERAREMVGAVKEPRVIG
jgi:serine phosphatase RsbU (regulator of sigma subunit)